MESGKEKVRKGKFFLSIPFCANIWKRSQIHAAVLSIGQHQKQEGDGERKENAKEKAKPGEVPVWDYTKLMTIWVYLWGWREEGKELVGMILHSL